MSDEKIEWSEQQPEPWKGAPLGSNPASVPPPLVPQTPSTAPTPRKPNFADAWRLIVSATKTLFPRFFIISLGLAVVGGVGSFLTARWLYSSGYMDDTAIEILQGASGGTANWTDSDWDIVKSRLFIIGVSLLCLVIFSALTQFLGTALFAAFTLRHFTEKPKRIPLWSAFRAQLSLFGVSLAMFIPGALTWTFTTGGTDLAVVLAFLAILAALVGVIWLSISTIMLIPYSIATDTAGFEAVTDTVKLSAGMRWLSLGVVLLTSVIAGIPGGIVTSGLDVAVANMSLENQFYYTMVSQFIAMPITLPILGITVTGYMHLNEIS